MSRRRITFQNTWRPKPTRDPVPERATAEADSRPGYRRCWATVRHRPKPATTLKRTEVHDQVTLTQTEVCDRVIVRVARSRRCDDRSHRSRWALPRVCTNRSWCELSATSAGWRCRSNVGRRTRGDDIVGSATLLANTRLGRPKLPKFRADSPVEVAMWAKQSQSLSHPATAAKRCRPTSRRPESQLLQGTRQYQTRIRTCCRPHKVTGKSSSSGSSPFELRINAFSKSD